MSSIGAPGPSPVEPNLNLSDIATTQGLVDQINAFIRQVQELTYTSYHEPSTQKNIAETILKISQLTLSKG
ncbi:MAG: hypothetical protein ACM3JI_03940 [Anaerolineae bacterium]